MSPATESETLSGVPRLSAKQLDAVHGSQGRVNLYHGSIRSGKTIGSLLRWLLFVAATLTKSGDLVMFGRTRDSVWRNCIGPMQDPNLFGPIAAQVRGNYGAPTVTILGRRVYVIGAHDVQAELVLRGLTVLGAYGDEITTIPEGFFLQMLGRMSTAWSKLFGTTNPDNPSHWLKKMIDRALPDWRVFHFVIDDNPSLRASYIESIKREYTGLWYRRFILGEWVVAEGAVYDSWDERMVVDPVDIPPMEHVLNVGVDYGTTNATAGILLGLAEGKLWLLDEWAPKSDAGRSLTDAEQSASFRAWLPSRPVESWRHPAWVHVDPAAASFRLQLFQDGVSNVAAAWNDVLPGIRMVASLMATDRLRVSSICTNFRSEVAGYSWDPKATERGEDAPIKTNDHFMDAARYAIASSSPTWRPHLPILSADTMRGAAA